MSASPQANQGLDDGAPIPAAYVPSHTAPDDTDGHDSDGGTRHGGAPAVAGAAAPAKLSDIEQHADENDVKDEEGEPSDDQPEDVGNGPEQDLDEELHPNTDVQGAALGADEADEAVEAIAEAGGDADDADDDDDKDDVRAAAKGEAEDDEDEDDEDEESEDQEEDDRPRKKRRRRRGGAQFLDIEADVDEDEDEEEEEGEEGFVANDNFIVEREARRNRDGSLGPAGADDGDDADFAQGDFDGDASHRRLDRRRMAQKDREAAELAEELNQRYRRNKYTTDGAEDWAPKAMLMPSEKDPRIWGIKCKTGRERDLILSISRKAVALAASDNGMPLAIISAFQRDSLKGYIYVEARSEQDVRTAVHGLVGLYMNGPNGIFLVDIEEMPDLLRTKQKRVDLQPGGWVRFKRGKYAGDLAQILTPSENGDEIAVKFIPRIDLAPKDDALGVGADGRKRKKGATMPLAFRPPQRLFNAEEIGKIYGQKEVQKRGNVLIFRGDEYHDGFCEKDVRVSSLNVEDVTPTIDELTRFQGDAAAEAGGALDLSQIADAARTLSKTILQPGDHVDIFEGDQKGVYGTVDSITNEVVIVTPHADLDLEGTKIEVPARSVRKRFKEGDHVKVMQGANADETGLVVKVEGDVVTFLSDLSSTEVSVFAKDVREAAEVGSGINVIAGYELHDLVQLDPQTAGVIIKMERDQFRVLDQTGSVRALKPTQLSGKVQTRFTVATDKDGFDIKEGEVMKESLPNNNSGIERRGKVLHVYRSMFAFLHSRDITENGGVFVAYARNLESTAPRPNKPSVGMGMNPDRLSMMGGGPGVPKVQVATGVQMGRDHRINRRVAVTRGTYKGNQGVIKDVTGNTARVELHSISKIITVDLDKLKERTDAGELIPLMDRPGGAGGYGARNGFAGGPPGATAANTAPLGGGAPGYGARAGAPGGMFGGPPGAGGSAAMYGGGRTPAPQYGGGRTPAPQYGGGKTPAPQYGGGKTPAPQYGGATPYGVGAYGGTAPGLGGATPAYAAAAYGRTPHYAGGAAAPGGAPGMGATPNPYGAPSASSRTPYGAAFAGGKTPDPRQLAGGRTPAYGTGAGVASGSRTPAYGAKNGYAAASAPTPGMQAAPTPAASGSGTAAWDADDWSDGPAVGAPTPAPTRDSGPDYNGAPTPYAGAPTPAAGAPTPGAYLGAPTPSAYPSGPTPGASGSYGAAAQTPGGAAGYYQTPYAGAATSAAEPLEEREAAADSVAIPHPSEWVVENVKIVVKESPFQGGRLTGQHGIVKSHTSATCTFTLDPYGDLIEDFPIGDIEPMPPYQAGQQVLVIAGDGRGERGVTRSSDGDEWWVELRNKGPMVVNVHYLVELVA